VPYDVIIVGAGPAGSTAARECAARGFSVLLLDKAAFPRDKPCGGGINVRAARLLPFDLAPVVERAIFGIRVSLRQSYRFARDFPEPLTYLTQRSRFDAFLVEQAVRAGVTLRERAPVRGIDRHASRVVVRAGRETFNGRALVAADGANGLTARLAGLTVRRRLGVALEANLTPAEGIPEEWTAAFGLDVGTVPGGYGWIFPRGDHLNIGVGGWERFAPALRARLERLTRFYGFDPADAWGRRGSHLPMRLPDAPLAEGNVLLVGDAAGLLDPLTGDGIYSALWSGRAAARHLAAYLAGEAPDLRGYEQEVTQDLLPDLHIAGRLHGLFQVVPAAFVTLIERTPRAWRAGCLLLRGELTYTGAIRRLLSRAFRWPRASRPWPSRSRR
jgi:geranylgeranyl reductase family protein